MSKLTRLSRVWLLIVCLLLVLIPASKARTGNMSSSTASSSQDADKQKLIEIEKALADNPASGPPATAVAKRYLYDGPLNHLTNFGRFGSFSKSKILGGYMQGKPFVYPSPDDVIDNKRDPSDPTREDPSDPHIKHSEAADLHVDVYGDTALVTYNQTNTDTGHKDPVLDTLFTIHSGCMDTFIKRNGQWYLIGTACSPNVAIPDWEWKAHAGETVVVQNRTIGRTSDLPAQYSLGFAPSTPAPAAVNPAQEAEKKKLIAIEKALANNPASGPPAAAVAKRYLYDGQLNHVSNFGRLGSLPKATVLQSYMVGKPFVFSSPDDLVDNKRDPSDPTKPDPSDPHVKHTEVSDFVLDVYGDAALVSYHQVNTDTGHKDPSLDAKYTFHSGCMDSFIKRDGQWYLIGNACAPNIAFTPEAWEASKKARASR
jgi:hypothetical protein